MAHVWKVVGFASILLLGSAVVGCCGCKKRYRCKATATYAGKAWEGSGVHMEVEGEAKKAAFEDLCSRYCSTEDPVVVKAIAKAMTNPGDEKERHEAMRTESVRNAIHACRGTCSTTATPVYTCKHSGVY